MIRPMLAEIGDESVIENDSFIFEAKLDGIRAMLLKNNNKHKLLSRNGIDITEDYPEFDFMKSIVAKNCILDGEIVVYDKKGNPSFHLWQEKKKGLGHKAVYVVFDILAKDDEDLTKLPLLERKIILEKTIKAAKHIQTSPYTEDGKKLWSQIEKRNLEGIVAKEKSSTYEIGKRSGSWLKLKLTNTIDCVILGFTSEKRALTSLALGAYHKNRLIFIGKVGTGFDETSMKVLREKLDRIETGKNDSGIIKVKPCLVAEVKYQNITKDNKLRAPVFLRLRDDKTPEECIL